MPARTGSTYQTTKGVVNTKKKTYTGKGSAPAGTTKVAEPSLSEVPQTTTYPSGKVVSSGYGSKRAAARARRVTRAARSRARLAAQPVRMKPQKSSQRVKAQPVLASAKVKAAKPKPPPTSKPIKFQGKPTAGTPTLRSLQTASKSKTLKVNQKGFVTTPPVRAAARGLKKAKAAAKRSGPKVSGPLTRGQKVFAKRVAAKTPLSPRVVAAQELAEQSGSAATEREVEGNHNWLNIGMTDSGPISLTGDRVWSNPKSAADATVAFLKGRKYGASEGIQAILPASKGRSDQAQIQAIANSGWATNPAYQQSIEGTHAMVSAKPGSPKAAKRLKRAKAKASKLGLKSAESTGRVTKKQMTRFKAAQSAAKELNRAKLPYVWGGGHGDPAARPTGGGLDCSGAVSYVLNKMGALKGTLVSGDMGSALEPGPGAVTVFYNPVHTFMRIGKRYFGTSSTNPGGGAGFIEGTPDDLSKYSVGHVPGLGKKVAVALGVPLSGSTSFPGMTLSSSGTSATIQSGVTVGKPGFSSKPIKLTPVQKARRKLHKLDELEVGVGSPTDTTPEQGSAPSTSELQRLEAKYGAAA